MNKGSDKKTLYTKSKEINGGIIIIGLFESKRGKSVYHAK